MLRDLVISNHLHRGELQLLLLCDPLSLRLVSESAAQIRCSTQPALHPAHPEIQLLGLRMNEDFQLLRELRLEALAQSFELALGEGHDPATLLDGLFDLLCQALHLRRSHGSSLDLKGLHLLLRSFHHLVRFLCGLSDPLHLLGDVCFDGLDATLPLFPEYAALCVSIPLAGCTDHDVEELEPVKANPSCALVLLDNDVPDLVQSVLGHSEVVLACRQIRDLAPREHAITVLVVLLESLLHVLFLLASRCPLHRRGLRRAGGVCSSLAGLHAGVDPLQQLGNFCLRLICFALHRSKALFDLETFLQNEVRASFGSRSRHQSGVFDALCDLFHLVHTEV
mmetsp:Transcript_17736/g.37992  ORF Transcript_17736/g.37992 Transcript_17736/m.37992 type:complete len:338 (-) Transcript_17736:863-1876(-)